MGIEQTTPSPYNSDSLTSYSFASRFAIDLQAQAISIVCPRYADKASFEAGKPPIEVVQYRITGDDFPTYVAANQEAYALLKASIEAYMLTRPEFAGGTVVP